MVRTQVTDGMRHAGHAGLMRLPVIHKIPSERTKLAPSGRTADGLLRRDRHAVQSQSRTRAYPQRERLRRRASHSRTVQLLGILAALIIVWVGESAGDGRALHDLALHVLLAVL